MATNLLQGYRGNGDGNLAVVKAIVETPSPIDGQRINKYLMLSPIIMARRMFEFHAVPYARQHWRYDGARCSCQDFADAMLGIWSYTKFFADRATLPFATKVNTGRTNSIVCHPHEVVGGAAGNVWTNGVLDGRSYFGDHYFAEIMGSYFDLTYLAEWKRSDEMVQHSTTGRLEFGNDHYGYYCEGGESALFREDATNPPPAFQTGWHCYPGFLIEKDWKTKTARSGHTRSSDLSKVDAALSKFFSTPWPNNYDTVKAAFSWWAFNNPKEAHERNANNCVVNMAKALGLNPAALRLI